MIFLAGKTDIGKERTNNEDAVSLLQLGDGSAILLVADGMGGPDAGEVASERAVSRIRAFFSEASLPSPDAEDSCLSQMVEQSFMEAQRAIMDYVAENPDSMGMGTTLVLLWLFHGRACLAWCGDSRCYGWNPHKGLRQLSHDHSLVQDMVDRGELSPWMASRHPDSHIITRCLGDTDASDELPEVKTFPYAEGDVFLLCSDGLCGYCSSRGMEKALLAHLYDAATCCDALIACALRAGGHDNIAVAVAWERQSDHPYSLSVWSRLRRRLLSLFKTA